MPHDALDWNPRTPIEVDGAATQKARRLQAKSQIEPLNSHVGSPSVSGTFSSEIDANSADGPWLSRG